AEAFRPHTSRKSFLTTELFIYTANPWSELKVTSFSLFLARTCTRVFIPASSSVYSPLFLRWVRADVDCKCNSDAVSAALTVRCRTVASFSGTRLLLSVASAGCLGFIFAVIQSSNRQYFTESSETRLYALIILYPFFL
uniref:Uncharacterized protein n=1 Tax=Gasterosteus aculeatus TaxID=69293 RepID=G3PRD7_GASAC